VHESAERLAQDGAHVRTDYCRKRELGLDPLASRALIMAPQESASGNGILGRFSLSFYLVLARPSDGHP